jgi:hypothetical protein
MFGMATGWIRVIETVGGLIDIGQRVTRGASAAGGQKDPLSAPMGGTGGLEARLAGVLVAALKEAFDRDRTRLELEQSQVDAERRRAEEALRLELRRQEGERAVAHARLLITLAIAAWLASALLVVVVPGARVMPARAVLAIGWTLLIGSAGTAFASYYHVASWLGRLQPGAPDPGAPPSDRIGRVSGFLLIAGLAGLAAALLLAV